MKPKTSNRENIACSVATVLTVYGIETRQIFYPKPYDLVATVLTVYGIETRKMLRRLMAFLKLQQCLPFTVLKRILFDAIILKILVATVLTVYGIETE